MGSRVEERVGGGGEVAAAHWRVPALIVVAVLFTLRVLAQLTQSLTTVGWLPAFDDWQSGALAYPVLFASQVAIIATQIHLVRRSATGRFNPRRPVRLMLVALGALYAGFMLFRLIAGATFLDGHGWFDAPLPSVFHLVLATFLLLLVLPNPSVEVDGSRS